MEFNAQITEKCKKYPINTYAQVEILLNTCRNTLDFMCDLELFSKIQSHIYIIIISVATITELIICNMT